MTVDRRPNMIQLNALVSAEYLSRKGFSLTSVKVNRATAVTHEECRQGTYLPV